jgi:hypothetical protein
LLDLSCCCQCAGTCTLPVHWSLPLKHPSNSQEGR